MSFFGIGPLEMGMILVIAILVFGPKKLPEIGKSLGKTIRGFQEASREFEAEFKREAEQIEQAAKTPTLPQSGEVAANGASTAESQTQTTTSQQS